MMRKKTYTCSLLVLLAIFAFSTTGYADSQQAGGPQALPEVINQAAVDQQSSGSSVSKPNQGDDKRPYAEAAIKRYNRGVELHQSGFLNQAIAEYKAAIDADKRVEEAYSNLGLIYASQRNYAKAIDAFNKALSLKPSRPTTLNGLGTVLYARGKVKEAMEKWRQAILVDPNFASAYYNMGNAYENEKDFPSALDAYVKAIKMNSSMADAFYRLGTIMNKDKHAAQACLLLTKAIDLSPTADFVRDAKKQVGALNGQFAKEETEAPEVQMNVLPPASGVQGNKQTIDVQEADKKTDAKSNVEMFIQPSQSESKAND